MCVRAPSIHTHKNDMCCVAHVCDTTNQPTMAFMWNNISTMSLDVARQDSYTKSLAAPLVWAATGELDMFEFEEEEDGIAYSSSVFDVANKHKQVRIMEFLIENNHAHNTQTIDKRLLRALTGNGWFPGKTCLVDRCTDTSRSEGFCPIHARAAADALTTLGCCRDTVSIIMRLVVTA